MLFRNFSNGRNNSQHKFTTRNICCLSIYGNVDKLQRMEVQKVLNFCARIPLTKGMIHSTTISQFRSTKQHVFTRPQSGVYKIYLVIIHCLIYFSDFLLPLVLFYSGGRNVWGDWSGNAGRCVQGPNNQSAFRWFALCIIQCSVPDTFVADFIVHSSPQTFVWARNKLLFNRRFLVTCEELLIYLF